MRFIAFIYAAAGTAALAAPSSLIVARGSWAAFDRGHACEAVAKPIVTPKKAELLPYVAIAFDRGGPRQGQLFVQLRRPIRPGSTILLQVGNQPFLLDGKGASAWTSDGAQEAAVMAAMRAAGGMRVEARDRSGRRMADRFLLDGAPTAIDAAASACSLPR